jgi:hypothetical protein
VNSFTIKNRGSDRVPHLYACTRKHGLHQLASLSDQKNRTHRNDLTRQKLAFWGLLAGNFSALTRSFQIPWHNDSGDDYAIKAFFAGETAQFTILEVQVITTADLKAQTRRELGDLARNYGVSGWHSLRKDELISEIKKVQRKQRRSTPVTAKAARSGASSSAGTNGKNRVRKSAAKPIAGKIGPAKAMPATTKSASATHGSTADRGPTVLRSQVTKTRAQQSLANTSRPVPKMPEPKVSAKTARIRAQLRKRRETTERYRDLSTSTLVAGSAVRNGAERKRANEPHQDRAILLVRGPYWLQANWEITRASVQRAQSALAENWSQAVPMLRLLSVGDVSSNGAESVIRDIAIHGGVDNWYIDVDDPPGRYRALIGYVTGEDDFYTVCRSNVVETPVPGECERLDEHWRDIAEDYERIYALSGGYDTDDGDLKEIFEERMHRSMPLRGDQGQTVTEPALLRESKLPFVVDAELIVFGKTIASASVQVAGKPVKLQKDGSFTVRVGLPDKRQVLPVTAESRDGLRQRTTVVAVERNTKVMETVELDERNA